MSDTAHIGVYAGAGAGGALLLGALIFYYCRQRRRGAAEARLAEAKFKAERLEMEGYRKQGINPDAFTDHGQEYSARDMKAEGVSSINAYNVPDTASIRGSPWEGAAAGAAVGAAAGGVAAMRSQNPRVNSPAPSTYQDARSPHSPRSPPPGGLGAPPGAAGAFRDSRSQQGGYGTPPPGSSPFNDPSPSSPASSLRSNRGPPRVSSPFDDPQHSPLTDTFGGPGGPASFGMQPPRSQSPMSRSQSPMIRSQSPGMPPQRGLPPAPIGLPVRTDTPPSAYSRMNANPPPSPRGYNSPRQNPGPGRQYSGGQPPYRGQAQQQGGDYWNQGTY